MVSYHETSTKLVFNITITKIHGTTLQWWSPQPPL